MGLQRSQSYSFVSHQSTVAVETINMGERKQGESVEREKKAIKRLETTYKG